jgi:hypothetical protein
MPAVSQPRKLFRGIAYSQWAYWCTLAMAAWAGIYLPSGSIRAVLIVTPVLPAILIVAVSYWIYAASDEYFRVRLLKSAVVTMVLVGSCTLAYFLLEVVGYPRLSMLWVNLLGMSIFNLQMLYLISRAR